VKEFIPLVVAAIALLLAIARCLIVIHFSARQMHTGAAADQGQFADVLCVQRLALNGLPRSPAALPVHSAPALNW
jgi:hypothetical protein